MTAAPLNQTEAARRLGVTREHLNRVLRGHRESRRLMAAWSALQSQSQRKPATREGAK